MLHCSQKETGLTQKKDKKVFCFSFLDDICFKCLKIHFNFWVNSFYSFLIIVIQLHAQMLLLLLGYTQFTILTRMKNSREIISASLIHSLLLAIVTSPGTTVQRQKKRPEFLSVVSLSLWLVIIKRKEDKILKSDAEKEKSALDLLLNVKKMLAYNWLFYLSVELCLSYDLTLSHLNIVQLSR